MEDLKKTPSRSSGLLLYLILKLPCSASQQIWSLMSPKGQNRK